MYWLLLCNPNKWFVEGDDLNRFVNKILALLGEKGDYETELWKLNKRMKMDEKIDDGDLGVIKVGRETRRKKMITFYNVPPLESGIYGIFKFVSTSYDVNNPQIHTDPISGEKIPQISPLLWKNEIGEIFGKIKVIDNFFSKNKIISKDESIRIMGETLFNYCGARDIPEQTFKQIQEYLGICLNKTII